MAEFEPTSVKEETKGEVEIQKSEEKPLAAIPQLPPLHGKKLNLSYTINLNLPATVDIEVFNAIFKSLKEHLLHD